MLYCTTCEQRYLTKVIADRSQIFLQRWTTGVVSGLCAGEAGGGLSASGGYRGDVWGFDGAVRDHERTARTARITCSFEDDFDVSLRNPRRLVPALPGQIMADCEAQIEEAVEDEAARIADEMAE